MTQARVPSQGLPARRSQGPAPAQVKAGSFLAEGSRVRRTGELDVPEFTSWDTVSGPQPWPAMRHQTSDRTSASEALTWGRLVPTHLPDLRMNEDSPTVLSTAWDTE